MEEVVVIVMVMVIIITILLRPTAGKLHLDLCPSGAPSFRNTSLPLY